MNDQTKISRLLIKVVPNSSRDQIVGWVGERLKIKVQAIPEKGKANVAVIKLLTKELGLKRNGISIESGETSENKSLLVSGVSQEHLDKIF